MAEIMRIGRNGRDRRRFELATDRQAIQRGQHDIEEQEVRMAGGGEGQRLLAAVGRQDLIALHGQTAAQDIDIHGLIIHDKEAGWGVHRGPPAPATGGTYAR